VCSVLFYFLNGDQLSFVLQVIIKLLIVLILFFSKINRLNRYIFKVNFIGTVKSIGLYKYYGDKLFCFNMN
jgi:hypothetical protein